MSKFEPNQIISLQISDLSEATVANFQNNGKVWISGVDEALLSNGKKNTVQAKQWLNKCYLDSALSETTVKRWYADFKRSFIDTNDAECPGRPNSAVVLENTKNLHKLILADCELKLREIAEELKISEGSVFAILHEHLSMRNIGLSGEGIKIGISRLQIANKYL